MIINRIYETKHLLSLWLVSFLVGLRTYQRPVKNIVWYGMIVVQLPLEATIPPEENTCIQFYPSEDEHLTLETCRGE